MSEEGGTKIRNRNVQQIGQQMGGPPQMGQQMDPRAQMGPPPGMGQQPSPEQMRAMQQQMMMQQQMQQQQMQQQQMSQPMPAPQPVPKSILKRTSMGPFSINNKNIRNGVIVVVLFILLNSKFIWRALTRIPMMGTFEPSILALIVNSLLAGIVFYIISTKINN
jgi:hypothetical protein